jgi:hypothetical protein
MINQFRYTQTDIIQIAEIERRLHPEATLQDYYKLFFQAYLGQGHFIGDINSAEKYLDEEMSLMENSYQPLLQDISSQNGLYRISVSAIMLDILSKQDYLQLFLSNWQADITWQEWVKEWQSINKTISSLFQLKTDDIEQKTILNALENQALVSHSNIFRLTYKPHYRVMPLSEEVFSKFPILKEYL